MHLNTLYIKDWLIGLFFSAEVSSCWRASTLFWSRLLASLTEPTGSTRLNTSTSLLAPAAMASTSHPLLLLTGLQRAAAPSGASAPGWESLLMMNHSLFSWLLQLFPQLIVASVWFCGVYAQSNQNFTFHSHIYLFCVWAKFHHSITMSVTAGQGLKKNRNINVPPIVPNTENLTLLVF